MKYSLNFILAVFLIQFSCTEKIEKDLIVSNESLLESNSIKEFNDSDILQWPIKDLKNDSIPGVSLERAFDELLFDKTGDTIIIAVIDMPVDVNHFLLKNNIWNNKNEIAGNNIDDDSNGFVDDLNGWNFLGNKNGANYAFMNYEYTRILKKYNSKFSDVDSLEIVQTKDSNDYNVYLKAKAKYKSRLSYSKKRFDFLDSLSKKYKLNKDIILNHIDKDTFNLEQLNSLQKGLKDKDELFLAIKDFKEYLSRGVTDNWMENNVLQALKRVEVMLGLNYNDRIITGDDVNDLSDNNYGNNIINHNLNLLDHGTRMAGIIVSPFGSEKLKSPMANLKIMPLCISGLGDENDKDLALAIRYAVDNGAKIINISSGKYYSINEDWVRKSIKYAEKKDVLIITSSGNDGLNLDLPENKKYPTDIDDRNIEFSKNFIRVGSSNYALDSTFVHMATNWGKTEVDVFAPGEKIHTSTSSAKEYTFSYGSSSSAAMVSKIAGIIKSYYPQLSASELKNVILNSGVKYDINSTGRNKTNFDTLSKTGSVANAYNAIILADRIVN